jgi:hypothetical protein
LKTFTRHSQTNANCSNTHTPLRCRGASFLWTILELSERVLYILVLLHSHSFASAPPLRRG